MKCAKNSSAFSKKIATKAEQSARLRLIFEKCQNIRKLESAAVGDWREFPDETLRRETKEIS
jgi:hypothetical protein